MRLLQNSENRTVLCLSAYSRLCEVVRKWYRTGDTLQLSPSNYSYEQSNWEGKELPCCHDWIEKI